jgi:hypothetical protein
MSAGRGLASSIVVAITLTLIAAPVAAQGDTDTSARRAFRLGQAHYENGEFEQAAQLFEEAYRLSHRPRLLYNAYVAYRDLQDDENSARVLRLFLSESTDLAAAERDQLSARLAALDRAIAARGPRTTDTTTQTQTTDTTTQTTDTTTDTTTQTTDTTTDTTTTTTDTSTSSTTTSGGGTSLSPIGFIVGGVGLAMVGAGIGTGVAANGNLSTLTSMCTGTTCPESLRSTRDDGQTLAIVTDVLLIGGAVATATGVLLIFLIQEGGSSSGESSATAGFACTHTGCVGSVGGTF